MLVSLPLALFRILNFKNQEIGRRMTSKTFFGDFRSSRLFVERFVNVRVEHLNGYRSFWGVVQFANVFLLQLLFDLSEI